MPKIEKHAKIVPEAEESQLTFILDTGQYHGKICFSATRLMFTSATPPIVCSCTILFSDIFFLFYKQNYLKTKLYYISFLPAREAASSYSVFMLPVDLYQ